MKYEFDSATTMHSIHVKHITENLHNALKSKDKFEFESYFWLMSLEIEGALKSEEIDFDYLSKATVAYNALKIVYDRKYGE